MSELEYVPLRKNPTFLMTNKQLIDYIRNAVNNNSPCVWLTSDDDSLFINKVEGFLIEINLDTDEVENGLKGEYRLPTSYEMKIGQPLRAIDIFYTASGRYVYISNQFVCVSVFVITNPLYKGPRIRCQTSVFKPKVFMPKMVDFFERAFFGKSRYTR